MHFLRRSCFSNRVVNTRTLHLPVEWSSCLRTLALVKDVLLFFCLRGFKRTAHLFQHLQKLTLPPFAAGVADFCALWSASMRRKMKRDHSTRASCSVSNYTCQPHLPDFATLKCMPNANLNQLVLSIKGNRGASFLEVFSLQNICEISAKRRSIPVPFPDFLLGAYWKARLVARLVCYSKKSFTDSFGILLSQHHSN